MTFDPSNSNPKRLHLLVGVMRSGHDGAQLRSALSSEVVSNNVYWTKPMPQTIRSKIEYSILNWQLPPLQVQRITLYNDMKK